MHLATILGGHLCLQHGVFSSLPNETAIKIGQTQQPNLPPPVDALRALNFPENRDRTFCFHLSKALKLSVCYNNSKGCKPPCD